MLQGYILGISYALICIALAFASYKLGVPKKYTRKIVHILVGFEWVILYRFMGASYHFLIVCVFFLILLAFSYFKNLMPMISSDSDNAPGTVYYALAMTVMAAICLFVPEMMLPFGIGVFSTSLGDGFAGLIGQLVKKYNPKVYKNKSLIGTLANFTFSALTAVVFTCVFDMGLEIWQCIMIGLLSAGLELIAAFGLDNIAVTLGTAFLAFAFLNMPIINIFIIPIVMTPFIVAIVIEKKVLTKFGLVLAVFLDAFVSITLGNFGFVLLLSFLLGSVIIDKVKKIRKKEDTITEKGDCRDAVQVIANGLAPMIMAFIYAATLNKIFIVAYVATLAEAFADTAASGIGAFSNKAFDLLKFKKINPGLSGGISVIGTLVSLVAAFVIGLIALAFGAIDVKYMLIASGAAFVGAIFDSILGSALQIKYKCIVCNEITEREVHCNKYTKKFSGFEFFDNDVVNLLSGFFAAFIAVIFAMLI